MNNEQKKPMDSKKTIKILTAIIVVLCLILVGLIIWLVNLIFEPWNSVDPQPSESTAATTLPVETTVPVEPLVMLDNMAEIYATNNDFAGWLRIDDTVIDYPVMYTPDEVDKYRRKDFDGSFNMEGELYISENCSLTPESDNLIVYGHNMRRGTMFRALHEYADEEFYKEHPVVFFSTLYEEREYEIVSVFYDRVYYKYETDVFKYYQFIDAENEEEFNEAMAYFKEHAIYDTGVDAEFGDKLLTLVTCSDHHEYGRLVVLARYKAEEPVEPTEPTVPVETTSSTAPTE